MRFHELPLSGAFVIDLEPFTDARGANTRLWCAREFAAAGLPADVAQINLIRNERAGTLRGFHYQRPPHAESKLFRVTHGAIFDVIVDLRPESATFGEWTGVELSSDIDRMLFVPERFGQGFQTLADDTQVVYQVTEFFTPDAGTGFRHDDPRCPSTGRSRSPASATRTGPGPTWTSTACAPTWGLIPDHRRRGAASVAKPRATPSASRWSAPAPWAGRLALQIDTPFRAWRWWPSPTAAGHRRGRLPRGRPRRGVRTSTTSTGAAGDGRGRPAVTDDPLLLCDADGIDAVVEVTGAVEHGAHVALDAIPNGKHIVTLNAELQGTVGPILKVHADAAGVIVTDSDGDQPGRDHEPLPLRPRPRRAPGAAGQHQGPARPLPQPDHPGGFRRAGALTPHMATSFADGTKITFEMALVANATGMQRVGARDVRLRRRAGRTTPPTCTRSTSCSTPGIVDYVVGAEPAPGVFCSATHDDPSQRHYLELYKLGEGPLYSFYTPYHLCHFEVPTRSRGRCCSATRP